jgi:hypothetical protein
MDGSGRCGVKADRHAGTGTGRHRVRQMGSGAGRQVSRQPEPQANKQPARGEGADVQEGQVMEGGEGGTIRY